ncbi:MAG: hypothetical protein GH159_00140 [Dehalococcoidia bacterium]|nr:hypothetical protein [Dehalococcoidia bacterium]
MKTYEWKDAWHFGTPENEELRLLHEQLRKRLNSGLIGTIPKLAEALKADEQKVAWALQGLCDCRDPEILINSKKGEAYFMDVIKLRNSSPRPFTDQMKFYGRQMR